MKTSVLIFLSLFTMSLTVNADHHDRGEDHHEQDKLVVLWTSDDSNLAERMVFPYVHDAQIAGWFDEVTLIVWGPSAKLLAENVVIQEKLENISEMGVTVEACIVCTHEYGVNETLEDFDYLILKPMGEPLSGYIKDPGVHVLTF